jgi:hypothetical protein
MRRIPIGLAFVLLCSSIALGAAAEVDLTKLDRTIAREPRYHAQPHYALLAFPLRLEMLNAFLRMSRSRSTRRSSSSRW